jgi:leucyl-tRNA---protein transferase
MVPLQSFTTPPHACSYLSDEQASLRYVVFEQLSSDEYEQLMNAGWRRFGRAAFRPVCESCMKCRPIRVDVEQFRPNQSQKRAWKRNQNDVVLTIGQPGVTPEKLALYDRYHEFQTDHVGWRSHPPKDPGEYIDSFVDHPFPVEEWCYRLDGRLIGVGYVDPLTVGPSAIYFYYDPDERDWSLGTFNVLSLVAIAAERRQPFVYLGYHVEGCRSLEYKATFRPNQILTPAGVWRDYRTD